MSKIVVNAQAPEFTLADLQGNPVSLGSFRNASMVYLVLNRGFS